MSSVKAVDDPRIPQVKDIINQEAKTINESNDYVEIVIFKIDKEGIGYWSWSDSGDMTRLVGLMETMKARMMRRVFE